MVDRYSGPTAVELFTQNSRISGQLVTGRQRVSDVFNQTDKPFIFEKATISSLSGEREPVVGDEVQVNRNAVVLIIPYESSAAGSASSEERATLRVTKERHRIVVEAPPISVTGSIHLLRETRLRDALIAIPSQFIPLTDATVTISGAPGEPINVEAAIINRSFIHIFYLAPPPTDLNQHPSLLLKRVP